MQCASLDHWLRMHTSDDTILLQLHSNVPKSEMQTADFGVTVTNLALQRIYSLYKQKEEAKMAADDRPQLSLYVDDQSAKAQEVGEHV